MENLKSFIRFTACLALMIMNIVGCNKKWDEHYIKPEYLSKGSVFELLASNPDYSQFTNVVKKSGLDSLLMTKGTFTVLAIKNGSLGGIDTISNLSTLRKIIGMHVISSSVYSDQMSNSTISSFSGKLLRFRTIQGVMTVNGIPVKVVDDRALNGVIQEVSQMLMPLSNLYEVVTKNSLLSTYKTFIDSSFNQVVDVQNNIKIGYDTLNQPVYQTPIIYKLTSDYLSATGLNDESVLHTAFLPTNTAVNTVLSNMLAARSGRTDLIIPRLTPYHKDTTVGYVFFPSGKTYPGDTAVLMNYLFNNFITNQEVPVIPAGSSSYTNINGNTFTIQQTQLASGALPASNGIYYFMNDVTLPAEIYRTEFMFLPYPKIPNPSNPLQTIVNPNILFSGGTNTSPSQSSNSTCYTGKYTRFNFNNVGGKVEFNFPFATKGKYKVNLKNYLDNNGSMVNASYGSQLLKQNINTSTQYTITSGMVDVDLGTITVASDGPVKITFTCAGVSPKTALKYEFCVDLVELIPVP